MVACNRDPHWREFGDACTQKVMRMSQTTEGASLNRSKPFAATGQSLR